MNQLDPRPRQRDSLADANPPEDDHNQTIDEFIEQVFNYPTLSETYKYAAYEGLGNLTGHKLLEG